MYFLILLLFVFSPHKSFALGCGASCGGVDRNDKAISTDCSDCCIQQGKPCTSLCSQNKCKWSVNNTCTSWENNGLCVNYCQNQVCSSDNMDMQIISCGGGTCGSASGSCGCGVNDKGNCIPCNTCDGGDIIVNGKSRC